jgi:hypothetical protein
MGRYGGKRIRNTNGERLTSVSTMAYLEEIPSLIINKSTKSCFKERGEMLRASLITFISSGIEICVQRCKSHQRRRIEY